ncbi:interferon-induced helicase C domain-containing protein 1-like [Patiria miniata]|uniref:RNA helicase n=1 Tax=Patiria miniata TaxID=46514 RepID=A0A913Z0I8_PATMI|nr:interferon-induced helicase C domain-containing protein 1-like [Patiria miniata]
MAASSDATVGVSPYRSALHEIGNNLDDKELKSIKFLCMDFLPKSLRETADACDIIEALETQGKISEENPTFLLSLLTKLKREDLKKMFLHEINPGGGQSPDQNIHQVGNPLPTFDPSSPQGLLMTPGHFPPTSPQVKSERPKTLRSHSSGSSSAGQSRAIFKVDGSPISTARDGQSTQDRSFARSTSLQNNPSGQSLHEAASPKVRASLFEEDTYAGSAQFSSQHSGTSGSPGSGFESAKKQNTGNLVQGSTRSSVNRMMRNMSLQESDQSMKASKSPGFPDNDDIETDSPMPVGPRSPPSQSGTGQGRGSATPSRVTPGTGAQSRSNPREMLSSQQSLGSTAWDFLIQSPNRNQPVRESRQPVGISSSHQGQGSTSGPLLDLSTDSPSGTGRAREARNPQGTSSPHHQSASRPLLDRSDGINPQARQERPPPEMAPEDQVRRMNQLFDQQDAREEARAIGRRQPTLRGYQRELAERPLQAFENHIICAPTGSGKTLTAAYICYEYRTWFEANVPDKHFKALFIVNMRHLTVQQRNAFRWYFPNKQDVQTIGEQQSFEDALKLDEAKPAVLMLTAQILVNAMKSDKIDIKDLDMLIFDECHHTDLKHPYNEIMKKYLKQKQRLRRPQRVGVSGPRLPFIIGLSASLGVGNEALSHLLTLCGNMDCKGVVRVLKNLEELEEHVNSPDQDTIEIVSTRVPNDKQFANLLEALMTQIEDQLPDIEEHPLPSHGCQIYEAEAMRRLTDAQKLGDRTAIIVYMYLYEYNRAMMIYDDLRVTDGLSHLEKFHDRRLMTAHDSGPVEEHCHKLFDLNLAEMKRLGRAEDEHSNEKLGKLALLLHGIFTEKPESKGIVLVRMKVATTAVADFIKKSTLLRALPCRVIPQRFVGQGDIEDGCLTEAQQKAVLESFKREDGCNVLVATDIAQEGLDMPACNFVIRYNFVSNEIGTVQSKGRARAEGSQCFLIVESGSLNQKREYDNRNKVKKMIEAMEELEAMTEDQRLDRIQERQNEILEEIRLAEEKAELHQSMTNLDRITVHCKECSAVVCKASELRRKGDAGHVSCISPEFKRWVKEIKYSRPQRFRDSETVGLIKCGTLDCGNQFGTMQNFLNLHPPEGYALKAQSFKIHHEMGGVKTPKMWKKAGFTIKQEKKD